MTTRPPSRTFNTRASAATNVYGPDPAGRGADEAWRRHVHRWTRWNHVRTLSCLGASAAFLAAAAQV